MCIVIILVNISSICILNSKINLFNHICPLKKNSKYAIDSADMNFDSIEFGHLGSVVVAYNE